MLSSPPWLSSRGPCERGTFLCSVPTLCLYTSVPAYCIPAWALEGEGRER